MKHEQAIKVLTAARDMAVKQGKALSREPYRVEVCRDIARELQDSIETLEADKNGPSGGYPTKPTAPEGRQTSATPGAPTIGD